MENGNAVVAVVVVAAAVAVAVVVAAVVAVASTVMFKTKNDIKLPFGAPAGSQVLQKNYSTFNVVRTLYTKVRPTNHNQEGITAVIGHCCCCFCSLFPS